MNVPIPHFSLPQTSHQENKMLDLEYDISCHCGASAQTIKAATKGTSTINLCHCSLCRHITGILCTSYLPIEPPRLDLGLKSYSTSRTTQRYFCVKCGCHVFYRCETRGLTGWGVATGVVSKNVQGSSKVEEHIGGDGAMNFANHVNIADTKDGGLSSFINLSQGARATTPSTALEMKGGTETDHFDALQASCHCGKVEFHITRPNESSRSPHSGLPDLIIPFKSGAPGIKNTEDRKWWLRPADSPNPTHYMAGTCACEPCRLTSGFEIQTWAFVPRSNIVFHISNNADITNLERDTSFLPLDFSTLPQGILRTYESSPGVLRESCDTCGATIFWHDRWRPDLIDVSVGLLRAPEGARAEAWLEWWKDRVSFHEDAGKGRSGSLALSAVGLVDNLADGLRRAAYP